MPFVEGDTRNFDIDEEIDSKVPANMLLEQQKFRYYIDVFLCAKLTLHIWYRDSGYLVSIFGLRAKNLRCPASL